MKKLILSLGSMAAVVAPVATVVACGETTKEYKNFINFIEENGNGELTHIVWNLKYSEDDKVTILENDINDMKGIKTVKDSDLKITIIAISGTKAYTFNNIESAKVDLKLVEDELRAFNKILKSMPTI